MEDRMDRSAAQAWLDAYVEAWKTYDRNQVEALFAEDVTYRYHPFDPEDEVLRGRDAVVNGWLEPDGNASTRDAEGTYDARYEVYAVDGERVVAVGTSTYYPDTTRAKPDRVYDNVFLIEFDGAGRCRAFTEYFMKEPDAQG
jgi:ketosteroid isomerase-like protein